MAKAKINGIDLYYEVAGQGHPLTLVHGFSGLSNTWDGQFTDFSGRYRVIRYDIRGQGQSGFNDTGNSIENWTSDLHHLLHHLKIEQTCLMGHSMGGYISLKFTLDHPDMVKELVIVCGNAGITSDPVLRQWVKRMTAVAASGVEAIAEEMPQFLFAPDFIKSHPDHIAGWRKRFLTLSEFGLLSTCIPYLARPSLLEVLPKIKVPTLVIAGDKDIRTLIDAARVLHEGIPGSRLVVIPDGGHMVHEEQPQVFNAIVSEFLEEMRAD